MKTGIVKTLLPLTAIVAVCVFVLLPWLRPGLTVTDDADWMVIRLSAFYQNFREGQFPVRFLTRLNYGYGYPVSNFLYPGFLYLGSILHVLGLSFQNCIKVIIAGSVIGGAIALFAWLRRFFGSMASLLGAASFVFLPYLLYDIYKRGSVGEVLAIAVILAALYAIEAKAAWLLTPCIALLMISHNTLAAIFLPVLCAYILLKGYWRLMFPLAVGVGISFFFWLPAFFERSYVLFNSVAVSDPSQYFSVGHSLVLSSLPFLLAGMLVGMLWKKERTKEWWFCVVLAVVSICFAIQLSSALWRSGPLITYVQFPYRFLSLLCIAGPFMIASLAGNGKSYFRVFAACAFVAVLALMSLVYQKSQNIVREEGFYTTNQGTTTVANEYMPIWAQTIPTMAAEKQIDVSKGNATIGDQRGSGSMIDFSVDAKEESVIEVHTMFYPGWGAMVNDKHTLISYDNPGGLIHIPVPAGKTHVYMAFRETVGRFLADITSLVCIVLYVVTTGILLVRKKKT
jgi:hypothetical protein